jgi:type I restriction enzyme S subunit
VTETETERECGQWPIAELPPGWCWAPFGAAFSNQTTSDKKLAQDRYEAAGSLAVVDQGRNPIAGYTSNDALRHPAPLPVVIFGDHTRCLKFIDFPFVQGADGVKVLRPGEIYDARFGFHALRALSLPDKGYSRHYKFLAATSFPVPPINEQRRIVAKLEDLQARSRRAREALDTVPPLLEKLRQSILAAAFRGDLTKDWRAKHQTARGVDLRVSTGVDTRQQRKRLWGSGRTADGVSAAWGEIPDSWKWVQVRDLNEDPGMTVQIGPMSMKSAEFVNHGTIVLNVGCVQRGRVDVTKADHLPSGRARDFERYRLRARDVLFTRSGTVGRCACLPEALDGALMTFHLLRVRPSELRCAPAYLMYAFQGCGAVAAQIDVSSVGATRAGFNTRLLEEMWVPLAPREEQEELLLRVSEHMLRIDAACAQLEGLLRTLDSLDRAILAKAFRGELVLQDPNDEPAEDMLARARSTNGAAPANGAPPKRGRPRATQRADQPNN